MFMSWPFKYSSSVTDRDSGQRGNLPSMRCYCFSRGVELRLPTHWVIIVQGLEFREEFIRGPRLGMFHSNPCPTKASKQCGIPWHWAVLPRKYISLIRSILSWTGNPQQVSEFICEFISLKRAGNLCQVLPRHGCLLPSNQIIPILWFTLNMTLTFTLESNN